MAAFFELYKGTDAQFLWRLKSANGQVIAIGGEGYVTKAGDQNGIQAVQDGCAWRIRQGVVQLIAGSESAWDPRRFLTLETRMELWQPEVRGAGRRSIRTSCVSGPCGWCWRSVRSPAITSV